MSQQPCPVCGTETRLLFLKSAMPIHGCLKCHHRFAQHEAVQDHVTTYYGDHYFTGGGAGYPDYLAERRLLRARGRRYAELLKRHTLPGRMLDVGAAAGFLLEGFRDSQWLVEGIEPNASMAEHARKHEISVQTCDLDEYDPAERYDLVTAIQVMGHFIDVAGAARKLHELTRPGGYCLVETWDHGSFTARLFGRSWHEYSPPTVLHYFHDDSLQHLMSRTGFSFVRKGGMLKWISGEHARSLFIYKVKHLKSAPIFTAAMGLIPRFVAVPYPGNDLKWWLFKKSRGRAS